MSIEQPEGGWNMQRVTTHPGVILLEDFLKPMQITPRALATRTKMPATRVGEILHGRRGVSPDTALRLSRFFGNSAEFWINLQTSHDLSKLRRERGNTIQDQIEPVQPYSVA